MGQLEKYGLYVLCLVIFLILGVTIWGGGDLPPPGKTSTSAIKAAAAKPDSPAVPRDREVAVMPTLESLLRSAERGPAGPLVDSKKGAQGAAGTPSSPAAKNASAPPNPAPKNATDASEANGGRATDPPKTAPAAGPRPTYKVRSKDTFEGIAKEVLGNAALRTEIARLNGAVDPTKLKLGQELLLPTAAEIAQWNAARSRPAATPGSGAPGSGSPVSGSPGSTSPKTKDASAVPGVYTVVKGDTFERIAAVALGSKKRVNELLELNPTIHPRELTPGQKIKLPKK